MPYAQTTHNAQSVNFYLFQGAAFLGAVEEGPLILLLSIEPQECSLSPGNGPEWHQATSFPSLSSQVEEATHLKQH